MAMLLGLLFGVLVALLASRRGYAWWAYFLSSPIVGAIALMILPDLNEKDKEFENKEELVRKGNIVGLWITGLTLGFLMIAGSITGNTN